MPACVHNAGMIKEMHEQERLTRRQAGGAFLYVEVWQSGLLHRAYLSADAWVSKPLLASREFESHCFHHYRVGPTRRQPSRPRSATPGLGPKVVTISANIVASGQSLNMSDWARHEHPDPRKTDRNHRRAHRGRRHPRHRSFGRVLAQYPAVGRLSWLAFLGAKGAGTGVGVLAFRCRALS
jgi:hypothetical protein